MSNALTLEHLGERLVRRMRREEREIHLAGPDATTDFGMNTLPRVATAVVEDETLRDLVGICEELVACDFQDGIEDVIRLRRKARDILTELREGVKP